MKKLLKHKRVVLLSIIVMAMGLYMYPPKCWTSFCFEAYDGKMADEIHVEVPDKGSNEDKISAMLFPHKSKFRFYADNLKNDFPIGSDFTRLNTALSKAGALSKSQERVHTYIYKRNSLLALTVWKVEVTVSDGNKIIEIFMTKEIWSNI